MKHAAEELSMAKGFCFNFFFLGEAQVSFSNGEEYQGQVCRGGAFHGQGIDIYHVTSRDSASLHFTTSNRQYGGQGIDIYLCVCMYIFNVCI